MIDPHAFTPTPCPLCPDMLTAPTAVGGGKPLMLIRGVGFAHYECYQRLKRHRRIVAKVLDEARQGVMELKGVGDEC